MIPSGMHDAAESSVVNSVLLVGKKQPLSAHHAADRMSSTLLQPQKGKVPQQGCSHGFQRALNTESC